MTAFAGNRLQESWVEQREVPPPTSEDDRAARRRAGLIGALYTMIAALGLGVGCGWALDRHFGTQPGWTVGLSMLGLVVGFYQLVRETMR